MIQQIPPVDYTLLTSQLCALMETDAHYLPVLSNASALLMQTLESINWAGFYLIRREPEEPQTDRRDQHDQPLAGPEKPVGGPAGSQAARYLLVLGPFQGKTACIHIAPGKGVCGTAVLRDQTVRVEDVHQFPGHIACDSASRSEIVIPLHDSRTGAVAGVMDIDSPLPARFTREDQAGLEQFAHALEQTVVWPGEDLFLVGDLGPI